MTQNKPEPEPAPYPYAGAVLRADASVLSNLSGFDFAPERCGYWCLVYVVLGMLLGEAWNTQGSAAQNVAVRHGPRGAPEPPRRLSGRRASALSSAALSRPSTRLPLLSPSPLGPAERSRSPRLLLLSPPSLRLFFFFGRRLRSLGEFNAPSIDCLRRSSCALVRR